MATTYTTVVGVFSEHSSAEKALEELRNAGFSEGQIGFIAPDQDAAARPGTDISEAETEREPGAAHVLPAGGPGGVTGTGAGPVSGSGGAFGAPLAINALDSEQGAETPEQDRALEVAGDAAKGGAVGGVVGAIASLLIPGIGPAIAGGILAATFGGVVLGAIGGGIVGALKGMGVPEEAARFYEGEMRAGRTLVTVKDTERPEEAMEILRRNGAYDATKRREQNLH